MIDVQVEYMELIENGVDPKEVHVVYRELYNDDKTFHGQKLLEGDLLECLEAAQDLIDVGDKKVRVASLRTFANETETLH